MSDPVFVELRGGGRRLSDLVTAHAVAVRSGAPIPGPVADEYVDTLRAVIRVEKLAAALDEISGFASRHAKEYAAQRELLDRGKSALLVRIDRLTRILGSIASGAREDESVTPVAESDRVALDLVRTSEFARAVSNDVELEELRKRGAPELD